MIDDAPTVDLESGVRSHIVREVTRQDTIRNHALSMALVTEGNSNSTVPKNGAIARATPSLPHDYSEVLEDLVRRRDQLVMKRLDTPLTESERANLRYIDWLIDQIECQEIKEDLDRLERLAQKQERLSQTVAEYAATIRQRL